MKINMARIDDRLIHGQVTTVWSKEAKAERIIICNDEVYHDEIRKTLLKQAAPPGIKVNVVSIEKAVAVYNNPNYSEDTVFLLFTNPEDVLRLVERDVKITSINIGGMAFKQGKRQLTKAVSVDQDDIAAFYALERRGVRLDLRVVTSDPPVDVIKKLHDLESK